MRHKSFIVIILGMAFAINTLLISLSLAQDVSTDASVELTAPGNISIQSVPLQEAFGSVVVSPVDQTLGPNIFSGFVEYADFRGTQLPYDLNVMASNFVLISGNTSNSYHNFEIRANGFQSTVSPPIQSLGPGDCNLNTSVLTTFSNFTGALTYSDSINLVHGSFGVETIAHCSIKPVVRITIPANQPTGSYRNTLTFMII